jgi:hypothetical protein
MRQVYFDEIREKVSKHRAAKERGESPEIKKEARVLKLRFSFFSFYDLRLNRTTCTPSLTVGFLP